MGFSKQEYTGVGCHFLYGIFLTQGSADFFLQADYLPSKPLGKQISIVSLLLWIIQKIKIEKWK